MKFNKILTFEAAKIRDQLSAINYDNGEKLKSLHVDSLEAEQQEATGLGLSGLFIKIQTDFASDLKDDVDSYAINKKLYEEAGSHWPEGNGGTEVKKVRFVICILALLGLAFAAMSRLLLNVSIVEMVKKPTTQNVSTELQTIIDSDQFKDLNIISSIDTEGDRNLTATLVGSTLDYDTTLNHEKEDDDRLRFDWTKKEVNIVLASLPLGSIPGILIGGGIAQHYGAKMPLFMCIFGSAVINMFTPIIARYNLHLFMVSRFTMGFIQGSLTPSLYELFGRWLTVTESSIFAPMIKVAFPMGSLFGTLLPGIMAANNISWPLLFYIGGGLCLFWSLIWLYVASSTPQENRYISTGELRRILRKKSQALPAISYKEDNHKEARMVAQPTKRNPPWLLIITNPSVLALTLVRFTYNVGVDFVFILMPTYLSSAFDASTETISAIYCCFFISQMVLITFVGWLAKIVVSKRTFGLSVTKWRKVFQGASNFFMALSYVVLVQSTPSLELAACCMFAVCLFWMLGAGGESMVPFDLSTKYPASIVGFVCSIGGISGIVIPVVCSLVVGENTSKPTNWNPFFLMIACAQSFGGLVFCLVLKAKPFLPEEKAKLAANNLKNNKINNKL